MERSQIVSFGYLFFRFSGGFQGRFFPDGDVRVYFCVLGGYALEKKFGEFHRGGLSFFY